MPLPTAARDYLFSALDSMPVILSSLLGSRSDDDPIWDRRPEPDRFTLREAVAHLADWEPIWLGRVQRILRGDHPFLPSVDEGQFAIDNRYSGISPSTSLARIREGRIAGVAFYRTIPDDAWDLTCEREFVGELTLQQQVYYILAHDCYHLRQAADWIR